MLCCGARARRTSDLRNTGVVCTQTLEEKKYRANGRVMK